MEFFIVLLVIITFIALYMIITYKSLISDKNKVKNTWSQIDIELQRRFDLVPSLIETIKEYVNQEENLFNEITEIRTYWTSSQNIEEKAELDSKLSNSLKTFFKISENYPDLKSNQNFIQLQEELINTKNKISSYRQIYNDIVTTYNIKLKTFPSNLIASYFKFTPEELFKAKED